MSNGACIDCLKSPEAQLAKAEARRTKPELRERHARRQHVRIARVRDFVRSEREKPCTDCGQTYPWYVTEFDHRDGRGSDDETVAKVVRTGNIEKIKAEIAKCDLLCANCHNVRTHLRAVANGERNA